MKTNSTWQEYLTGWRSLERKLTSGEYSCPITALVYGSVGSVAVTITRVSVSPGKPAHVVIEQGDGEPFTASETQPYGFKSGRDALGKPVLLADLG